MFRHAFISILAFLFFQNIYAQEGLIQLENPSFEGEPKAGQHNAPFLEGWLDCGFAGSTPPDVHPETGGGAFGVTLPPNDGKSYLGLVIRTNETYERIGQKLSEPLRAKQDYAFSIHIGRSKTYRSVDRTTNYEVNYYGQCVLRIWGGNGQCDRGELLATSPTIINDDWVKYDFVLSPSKDFKYIMFEAFYVRPVTFPYNAHLLLDNASALEPKLKLSTALSQKSKAVASASPIQKKDNFFDTSFEITIFPKGDDTEKASDSLAQLALDAALKRAIEVEKSVESDMEKLYARAKQNKGHIPGDDLWFILNFAKEAREKSKGSFEITMGNLEKLWDENAAEERKPSPAKIKAIRRESSLEFLRIDKDVGGIKLLRPEMPLDIVNLARGYVLDCMADVLYSSGQKVFFIKAGDMAVAGEIPDEAKKIKYARPVFVSGIKREVDTRIYNSAIVTTRPSRELFKKYGDSFYDLIDPVTGEVIRHNSIVTVEAASAMHAYAWAKALTINYDEEFHDWLLTQDTRIWYSEP